MRPLPPGIQEALDLRTAFTPLVIVEASRLGQNPVVFQPSAGRVSFDNRRTVYGDGELSLPVAEHPTISSTELLTPFGTRIAIDLGVIMPSGVSAAVPCGRFVVDSSSAEVAQADPPLPHAHLVNLKLVDLSKVVSDYRFETPFTTPEGDLAAAVNAVVGDRTGTNPALPATGVTIAARTFGLEADSDPWAELTDMVRGFGYYLFYDRDGSLRLIQPGYVGAPRAIAPLTLGSSFDRRPANVVVARGESPDSNTPPVSAVAMDTNPSSPTYAGTSPGSSPYGRITRFYSSPLLTTVAQAQAAAETVLASQLAEAAAWTINRAWDPTVDPFDVLAVADELGTLILGVDAVSINIGGTTDMEVREL